MKKINYVKYLTKKDLKDFAKSLDLKILENKKGSTCGRGIRRLKSNDEDYIICVCKKVYNKHDFETEYMDDLVKDNMGMFNSFYLKDSDIVFLKLENFMAYETLDIRDDLENQKRICKKYNEFMCKKFGTYYEKQFKKFKSQLLKEAEEEKLNEQ